MSMKVVYSRLLAALRNFGSARNGNVAITFAFATLPLIGMVGAAVDYSHANSVKAAMQAALDSTAMMLSKEAPKDTTSQLQANAQSYFTALFTRPEAKNVTLTVTFTTTGGSQLVVNGSALVPTTFLGVMGYQNLTVNDTSTVKWGSARLRVALVLDNTGSMSQSGKLSALQTATKNLLTQLNAAAVNNGDVYVSIIPFVKDVNLDPVNYSASWIDWTDWNAINGTCSKSKYTDQNSCTSNKGTWASANHNTWNGCVVDRGDETQPNSANYDTNVVAPTTSITATMYSAEQYSACPQAVMELSYNWSAMTALVNSMTANGNTNQAIGLQLGWMSLTGGGPFTAPAMDPNYTYQQVIIILTDGLNTQDRWYTSQSSIDNRQQMTCNNIKAAGITLYTIQVDTDGAPTSTLLQNCASSSDKFFLLMSSTEIVTTFNTIGNNLSKLYVANRSRLMTDR